MASDYHAEYGRGLTRERELELARIIRGDGTKAAKAAARDELVLGNMLLVCHLASRLSGRGVPEDELIQEGYLGAVEAAEKFDPAKHDIRFGTYAYPWILRDITRANKRLATVVSVPYYATELLRAFKVAAGGQPSSAAQVREAIGCSEPEAEIVMAAAAAWRLSSRVLGGRYEQAYKDPYVQSAVREAMSRLGTRMQQVLRLRAGMGCRPMTQPETGRVMGVSHQRIQQIEREAYRRLRPLLEKYSGVGDERRIRA